MGKFLNTVVVGEWGFLMLFEALAGGTFDHLNYWHTQEFDQNFSKKSNARRFSRGGGGGEHGLFWNRSVQNADYRKLQTIVFTMQSELDNNSPIDCFLTLKTMVCIQSAVYILYCPVLEWTGTLVRKCVHKQSYINYKNDSLHQILTNSGKPTFDIFSFITSGPTDKLCKLNDLWASFPPLKTHISVHVNEPNDDG